MTASAANALRNGEKWIGWHEQPDGSNCNPWSERQYGVRCPGGGYCMSAAAIWWYDAGFRWGATSHGELGPSHTDELIAWARANGLWRDPDDYIGKPGDLVVFNWNHDGTTDHVGMVKRDDGTWTVLVEGNTGNGVYYRTRNREDVVAIVAMTASPQIAKPADPDLLRFLAALDHLKKRVARDPLEYGNHGDDVQFLNELYVHAGLRGWVPDMSHYKQGTRDATWLAKKIMRKHGLLEAHEKSGLRVGPKVVDWLVHRG